MKMTASFTTPAALSAALGLAMAGVGAVVSAEDIGTLHIAKHGYMFTGGEYNDPANPMTMSGQMYVHYMLPAKTGNTGGGRLTRYPIVMIHGGGQTGTNYEGTSDGRPGWMDFFVKRGWPAYVVDQPGRGRSGYYPNAYGPLMGGPNTGNVQRMFTAPELTMPPAWPQAPLHSQWPGGPGSGVPGMEAFDQFFASQVVGIAGMNNNLLATKALVDLLDKIGPAILVTHSASGPLGWTVADARPQLVKAVLAMEPNGPPFRAETDPVTTTPRPWGISNIPLTYDPPVNDPSELSAELEATADGPDLQRCWKQTEPARQLPNLKGVPILIFNGEASYHAPYDHCTSKYLTAAGVENEHIRLNDVGLFGNGHMIMLEANNLDVAAFLEDWLIETLKVRKD